MDGVILTLAQEGASMGWCNYSGETLVWIFCGLENAVKDCRDLLAVHQSKCTLGKMETLSRLASDGINNLWVKLCNLCRV
jgi:hypothetical protein